MKKIQLAPIIKLLIGLAASVLLTVAVYYGAINIGLSVAPAGFWHRELQGMVLAAGDSSELMDYAYLLKIPEQERTDRQQTLIEQYRERFDPANTNLRYTIQMDGQVLESTYDEAEGNMATRLRSDNIFVGTDAQLRQLEAYENYYRYGGVYDPYGFTVDEEGYEGVDITPSPRVTTYEDEATPEETPKPTPLPEQTETEDKSNEAEPKYIIISAEEYNALQKECYVQLGVAMYVVDIDHMAVDDVYHQVYLFAENIIINARDDGTKTLLCLCLGVLLVLALIVAAGKRDEEGNAIATGTGKLPWDVWLVLWCCAAVGIGVCAAFAVAIPANIAFEGVSYYDYDTGSVQWMFNEDSLRLLVGVAVAAAFVCVAALVGTVHSIAARVKVPGWWRKCLCGKLWLWCWKWCKKALLWCWKVCKGIWNGAVGLVKGVPMIWQAALVLGVVAIGELIFIAACVHSTWAAWGTVWTLVKCAIGLWLVLMLKRLHDGARVIADGDLTHRIGLKNLYGALRTHAEYLNRIGDGLSRSVDSQLRSERMKTELITNVSHDLKTPLTSIVNYVDLLKKENLTGTAGEYVEVLERQSARLKKLTEDLVEASKASSGALQVTTERANLHELMEQVQAEYGLRLADAMLTPIVRVPEGKAEVWADGKYVWRILDNLLGNVCKYAMPGTRVYLELTVQEETATLSVKNMSREPLNISAAELTERFVRGDASRNTEGSGLGLSIAQSLAKLMGGDVQITIDGDLFKAEVCLPLVK